MYVLRLVDRVWCKNKREKQKIMASSQQTLLFIWCSKCLLTQTYFWFFLYSFILHSLSLSFHLNHIEMHSSFLLLFSRLQQNANSHTWSLLGLMERRECVRRKHPKFMLFESDFEQTYEHSQRLKCKMSLIPFVVLHECKKKSGFAWKCWNYLLQWKYCWEKRPMYNRK